jgi:dienelactone hydrolase
MFDYDASTPLNLETVERFTLRDIRFASPSGNTIEAYVVTPVGPGPFPGVLYVHWYEPHSPITNRLEFLSEAAALAHEGAVSLLISTMWSQPRWFFERDRADDHDASIRQVIDLRRAVDVLASLPQVDVNSLGYVGHDFGAMYGAILASLDRRLKTYVLLAGTSCFSDWYLLGSKIQGEEREQYIQQMAKFDPVHYIGQASPASVFLQFAKGDFYVPEDKAQQFFDAARDPKKMETYENAGHDLDDRARHDRVNWLKEQLRFGML